MSKAILHMLWLFLMRNKRSDYAFNDVVSREKRTTRFEIVQLTKSEQFESRRKEKKGKGAGGRKVREGRGVKKSSENIKLLLGEAKRSKRERVRSRFSSKKE